MYENLVLFTFFKYENCFIHQYFTRKYIKIFYEYK